MKRIASMIALHCSLWHGLLAVAGLITLFDDILQPKGERIQAQFFGDDIEMRFQGKNGLRAARAAISAEVGLVRVYGVGVDL